MMIEEKRYSNRPLFKTVALCTAALLLAAARDGDVFAVQEVIKAGEDVKLSHSDKSRPLMLAVQGGHANIVKILLDAGVSPKQLFSDQRGNMVSTFHIAAQNGHEEVLKILFSKLNGPDLISTLSKQDSYGFRLLCIAAQKGHTGVVQELIKAGADVGALNSEGVSPLWNAAQNGHEKVVQLLLEELKKLGQAEFKSALNQKYSGGVTALWIAAQNGHASVVELLVDALKKLGLVEFKAALNEKDSGGATALWIAAQNGHVSVVELLVDALKKLGLVEFKAALNQREYRGVTALMQAACMGKIEVVNLLLEAGVDTKFKLEFAERVSGVQKAEIEQLLKDVKPAQKEADQLIKCLTPNKSRWRVKKPVSDVYDSKLEYQGHPSFIATIQKKVIELENTSAGSASAATEKTGLLAADAGSPQQALITKLKEFLPNSSTV